MEEKQNSLATVPYVKVVAALEQIKKFYEEQGKSIEEINISFEYLIGSFYPHIMQNIQKDLNNQYMKGYIQGREDAANEIK